MKKILLLALLLAGCSSNRVIVSNPGKTAMEFDYEKKTCASDVVARELSRNPSLRIDPDKTNEWKADMRENMLECMRAKGWLQYGESREANKQKYPDRPPVYPDPPKGVASPKCMAQCKGGGGTQGFCESFCESEH